MAILINIYGTARSGSTMLDLILGNAADAFSCGEVSAWFRPYRQHHFNINCSCGSNPCLVWERIKSVPENEFHAYVIKRLQVDFVIDSSKDLCWLIDAQNWAIVNGIKTVNLILWKNPIDLSYSYWKRGYSLSYWRQIFVNTYSRFLDTGLPFRAINYNDLIGNPRGKIAEICAAVEMQYFEGKERFWVKEHHYLFGSAGVRRQVNAKESVIYSRETYSPEFEGYINSVQNQIERDSQIQHLIKCLIKADVSSVDLDFSKEKPLYLRRTYPVWYYRKRLFRNLRRYFPEEYDASVK